MDNMKEIDGALVLKREKKKDRIYDIASILLSLLSLFLGFLIYAHNDAKGVYISKLLSRDISFEEFNININRFFDNFFNFQSSSKDSPVLGEIQYISLGDDRFKSTESYVQTLDDGTVTYITLEEDNTYSLVVSYDSFVTIYKDLIDVTCASGDRIKGGLPLGGYEESFKAYFKKGESFITYQELFAQD